MLTQVSHRLLAFIPTLFVASIILFFAINVVPGSAARGLRLELMQPRRRSPASSTSTAWTGRYTSNIWNGSVAPCAAISERPFRTTYPLVLKF